MEHATHHPPQRPGDHDRHAGHSVAMFRDRFWLSFALTVPVVFFSETIQHWLGISIQFPGSRWIPALFGSIIFFYGGVVFLKSAWHELQARMPGMMTLISLAILAAYFYSLATTFFITGTEFFWELSTLITIMLLGHWLEMRSVGRAQGALQELAKLLPDTAEVVDGDQIRQVQTSELKRGDLMLIRPGAKVPADGVVVKGTSSLNESMITGESRPVSKSKDSEVIAGTVNGEGSLRVRISKVGEETALAGIMRLVAEAQTSKSRAQILADRAAFYLTVVAIIAGAVTLVAWVLSAKGFGFALERTVTVLVIACPHALGLAVPLVTSISTTLAAKSGLLVRERMALESARNIDVVLFDKTGTLTQGEHGVVGVYPENREETVVSLAASIEAESEHPIAQGIVRYAQQQKIKLEKAKNFQALPGRGAEGTVSGKMVAVGGPALLSEKSLKPSKGLRQAVERGTKEGSSVIYVVVGAEVAGALLLADLVRKESKEAVAKLTEMGVRVAMLTGDSEAVASSVAKSLDIKEFFAEVLPEHKVDKVKELQRDGSRVAMVGDGVNDAPALTQADVGIAIGAGTDVAIESAGIILVKNDPRDVVKVIELSRATYRKMAQNLVWATGYNVVAIPLAAGVFASVGLLLAPALGALLMSLSTVVVAGNAQLLRRVKLTT